MECGKDSGGVRCGLRRPLQSLGHSDPRGGGASGELPPTTQTTVSGARLDPHRFSVMTVFPLVDSGGAPSRGTGIEASLGRIMYVKRNGEVRIIFSVRKERGRNASGVYLYSVSSFLNFLQQRRHFCPKE